MSFSYGYQSCVDPALLYAACSSGENPLPTDQWWGKVNLFRVPLGEKPGTGQILLANDSLDKISLKTWNTLRIFGRDTKDESDFTLQKITLTRAVCVVPSSAKSLNNVYLCDLADRRFHLARIPVDKAYNQKDAAGTGYLPNTLNSGALWTWQQIIDDLLTTLGITFVSTAATLSPVPSGTPENLGYHGSFAWHALCDVMTRIGWSILYDPITDTFTPVNLSVHPTRTSATANKITAILDKLYDTRRWDGYPIDKAFADVPEKVRVRFPRRPKPMDGNSPWYMVDVSTAQYVTPAGGNEGVQPGTFEQIDDDLTANASFGTPSNSAALATRADARTQEWVYRRQGAESPFQQQLDGIYKDAVGALSQKVGEVIFGDRGEGPWTALVRRPDGAMGEWTVTMGPDALPGAWARIVGNNGNGSYSMTFVDDGNKPGFANLTGNSANFTAWEAGNSTTVANGVVRVYPDQRGSGGWSFRDGNGTGGNGTGGAQDCGALAGLNANSCLFADVLSGSGNCANVPTAKEKMDIGNATTRVWNSNTTVDVGVGYTTLHFTPGNSTTQGQPRAWLDAFANYSLTWLTLSDCSGGNLTFKGGPPYCGNPGNGPKTTPCPPDTFSVTFNCNCCGNWTGSGWYCIDGTTCEYMANCPANAANITAGPYPSELSCLYLCGNGTGEGYYCANYTPGEGNYSYGNGCYRLGPDAPTGWNFNAGPFSSDCSGNGLGNQCQVFELSCPADLWYLGWPLIGSIKGCNGEVSLEGLVFERTDPGVWECVNFAGGLAVGSCVLNGPLVVDANSGNQLICTADFTFPLDVGNQTHPLGFGGGVGTCAIPFFGAPPTTGAYQLPMECGCDDGLSNPQGQLGLTVWPLYADGWQSLGNCSSAPPLP